MDTRSNVPLALKRISLERAMPLTLVKLPPMIMLPSGSTIIALTEGKPLESLLKVAVRKVPSAVPLLFNLISLSVKTKYFPSGNSSTKSTAEMFPALKELSRVPSAFKRTKLFRANPFTPVKEPPTIILPSVWITMRRTTAFEKEEGLPNAGLKPASKLPFGLRRAIPLRGCPLTPVSSPPIRILPSVCKAIV